MKIHQRKMRDSNPRYLVEVCRFSRPMQSTISANLPFFLVERVGFEPTTPCLQSKCSIQSELTSHTFGFVVTEIGNLRFPIRLNNRGAPRYVGSLSLQAEPSKRFERLRHIDSAYKAGGVGHCPKKAFSCAKVQIKREFNLISG